MRILAPVSLHLPRLVRPVHQMLCPPACSCIWRRSDRCLLRAAVVESIKLVPYRFVSHEIMLNAETQRKRILLVRECTGGIM